MREWLYSLFPQSARQRAVQLLRLRSMERVLIVGVRTGIDIPLLPPGLWITGVDSNPRHMQSARKRAAGRYVTLEVMDLRSLHYSDFSFDAALLTLALGSVSNSPKVFQETWRVIRPGGRLVILDSFLPDDRPVSPLHTWFGRLSKSAGIGTNQKLLDVIGSSEDMVIETKAMGPFNGWYQILLIRKDRYL